MLGGGEARPERGRILELDGNHLKQVSSAGLAAEIDTTQPFQYQILDRYDVNDALIRLYQGGRTLTFYTSDPGGVTTVRDVIQIDWPPRPRHAGRSYPPA
jgi:hypothetical protein